MSDQKTPLAGEGGGTPRRIDRRKFLVVAGGATALLLTPGGLQGTAAAQELSENVTLGEGEILLDAVTRQDQLWTLVQTPAGPALRVPTGDAPSFPSNFQAESLGRSGSQIIAGGHRFRPVFQRFVEGNYATLVATSGIAGLASQPGLDTWPTEATYEFETEELVPAYVVLSGSGWSAPIDVPDIGDVAGSVTSVVGRGGSLELVVDSLLDSQMRESASEILQVSVSIRSGSAERTHIADTVHGTSTVIGQSDDRTYVLASSLDDGRRIVAVGEGEAETVPLLGTELNLLSVSVEDGQAELFVEGDNGDIGSIPLEEASRLGGDIDDRLQDEPLAKRSFGEDVVLAYQIEGSGQIEGAG